MEGEDFLRKFQVPTAEGGFINGLTGVCSPLAILKEVESLLAKERESAERRGRERAVADFGEATGVNAIPTTDEYANGWNDCRKVAWEMRQKHIEAARKDI